MEMRIPLSAPEIIEDDIAAVVSALRTTRLSIGPRQTEFERVVAEHAGVPHGVAVSSGTGGLHICLRALGISEGDEVILPSFTFIAAGNAVLYERAIPVFADIDPATLNLNPTAIENRITPRTRAILAVHTFGRPADLGLILEIASRHKLPVIEDACEALGAEYRGRKAGGTGRAGVYGFYPNKVITTGEGGMVVTSDPNLADIMRALRNQGRMESDGWLDHKLLGYNYRISELNCALGLSQMRRLDATLDRRADRALKYSKALSSVREIIAPELEMREGRVSWFVFVVQLADGFTRADRDWICAHLAQRGIGCGRYFAPLHRQPLYARFAAGELPVTDHVADRCLALPFFNALTDEQIAEVCDTLREAIRTLQVRARSA